jgi:myo-inositol-1(or 4)-monophosphatase
MDEITLIETFLRENCDYVRDRYRNPETLTVTEKMSRKDLLTDVDLTLQKRFADLLKTRFPADTLVGEEEGADIFPKEREGRTWLIDPVDGTYNFVRGMYPIFGVSVAFAVKGLPMAAGVLFPERGDLFLAQRDGGCWRNGEKQAVSEIRQFGEACIQIDFSVPEDRNLMLRHASDVIRDTGQLRCYGCAVAGICQIASADAEGYLHMNLPPWDYAAAMLIVEEAGGRVSRLGGGELHLFDAPSLGLVISNGAVHDQLLSRIRD